MLLLALKFILLESIVVGCKVARLSMKSSEVGIGCSFGATVYGAGDLVSALVQAGGPISVGRCFAQAYGHLFLDQKWQKQDYDHVFSRQLSIELSESVAAPPKQCSINDLTPHCVYLTPREELNTSMLSSEGLILQFQLPTDVFPTFRGMSCSINYTIAIFWESNEHKTAVYFPFRVSGTGSSLPKQYIRFSHMVIFAVSGISEASFFQFTDDLDDDDDSIVLDSRLDPFRIPLKDPVSKTQNAEEQLETTLVEDTIPKKVPITPSNAELKYCAWGNELMNVGGPSISYGIRTDTDDLICVVNVPRLRIYSGDVIRIWLAFDQATLASHSVRATLLQQELRLSDGALLKETDLDTCHRFTRHAFHVCLTLQCTDQEVCSFRTPFSEINYVINFEFVLLKQPKPELVAKSPLGPLDSEPMDFAEMDNDNVLPWSLPLRLSPYPCLGKYVKSYRPHNSSDAASTTERKGYHIYTPESVATSAHACLEPLVFKVATLPVAISP